ncbi:MAG: hypothetical protein ACI9CE_002035 [Flavobacterium sp.]|jgi:hypothetical protein
MDRREEHRVSVNMNATVIKGGAHPILCRVGNLSSTGIMLRQDGDSPKLQLDMESEVNIRLSLKQGDTRKVLELQVKIVREEHDQLGGEFLNSQPELLDLIQAYQTGDSNQTQLTDSIRINNRAP